MSEIIAVALEKMIPFFCWIILSFVGYWLPFRLINSQFEARFTGGASKLIVPLMVIFTYGAALVISFATKSDWITQVFYTVVLSLYALAFRRGPRLQKVFWALIAMIISSLGQMCGMFYMNTVFSLS